MALLIGPGTRIIDASGKLISGGKVRVYNRNTTTLSSIYSDAAMGSALTNPCVANASGYPSSGGSAACQIFAASGQYDVAFLDASNNVLASFEDVPTYGEENGDLSRTVTGNGRFLLTGAAGAVLMQAGDPSPDNTGGTLTIEGWAGTQLDSLTLDAANTNTTGRLQENSLYLPGILQANTPTTFTGATTVDIPLTNTPAGLRAWDVEIFDLTLTGGATGIQFRLSYDGGATYKSGGSDYEYGTLYNDAGTPTSAVGAGSSIIVSGSHLATNGAGYLRVRVITPNSGTAYTVVQVVGNLYDTNVPSRPRVVSTAGNGVGGYGRATHLRLVISTGGVTATGKYRVARVYGFGE